jgi:secreted Zn-dependent insulinase-like peptidase
VELVRLTHWVQDVKLYLILIQVNILKSAVLQMDNALYSLSKVDIMTRTEIMRRFENVLVNSNIDPDSKIFKQAIEALIAICTKEIEDTE